MAEAPHPHSDERSSYYLDQLFMIGVCGALAGVTIMLWYSGSLTALVHPKFALAVGAGGIALLGIVALRAAAVWFTVDEQEAGHVHGPGCDHSHSHGGHAHSHGQASEQVQPPPVSGGAMGLALAPPAPPHTHSHSHGHGHSHSHGDGHDHGGAPWRYIVLLLPVVLYFLVLANPAYNRMPFDAPANPQEHIHNFILIFRSILWEALPFIILGAFIAGLLEELLPPWVLSALIPRNVFVAVCAGALLGLIFPMCECGIIPIMRRLLRKGLPLSCCIAYLLAGPIINFIVLLSTVAAFSGMENVFVKGQPSYQMGSLWMTGFRAGLGFAVAVVTALIVEWQHRKHGDSLLTPLARPSAQPVEDEAAEPRTLWQRVSNITETSLHDFVDITVFLILGALLSATVRIFVGPEEIAAFGSRYDLLAIGLMMLLAIVLCLCSEADAFVAASFVTLRPSAKLAFLVLGPMLDLKLYAMYTRIFRPRLIFTIYGAVLLQVFVYSVAVHAFWEANAPKLINPRPPQSVLLSEQELQNQAFKARAVVGEAANLPPGGSSALPYLTLTVALFASDEKVTEMNFLRLENAALNPQLRNYYTDKLVRMKGMFSGNEQVFTLLRYKRNCCAADATPLRARIVPDPAHRPVLNANLYRGKWVEVTGRIGFQFDEYRGTYVPTLVLKPRANQSFDDLVKVVPPDPNPYVE